MTVTETTTIQCPKLFISHLTFIQLSKRHVYRIEYALYRQGPYQICIDTAADRMVPALLSTSIVSRNTNAMNG